MNAPAQLDPNKVNMIIDAVTTQRNVALNQVVNLQVEIAIRDQHIAMLKKVILDSQKGAQSGQLYQEGNIQAQGKILGAGQAQGNVDGSFGQEGQQTGGESLPDGQEGSSAGKDPG